MQEFLKQTEVGLEVASTILGYWAEPRQCWEWVGGTGVGEATVLPNAATLVFLFCLWKSALGFNGALKAECTRPHKPFLRSL